MKITQNPSPFRPLTIVIETKDELDQLTAVLWQVAENKINHPPMLVKVAQRFCETLMLTIGEE